ncbi:hypothetical protein IV203_038810 [Nitzschia inconspicua]|uniref:Uncharacterized protein n=1 Tax=Nitzschia inconspicua TaxID=303405 RepID=A0A9K3PZS5_9STRA|nr:hypothetical protein IV203_038810 [Nitzschia inconspicua]
MVATKNGKMAVMTNTSWGFMTSSKDPEKYAESKPPTAALPQQRDCKPPAILGSFESRVFCTTIPSATTSEKAIQAELTTNETTVAGIFQSGLESKSPQN